MRKGGCDAATGPRVCVCCVCFKSAFDASCWMAPKPRPCVPFKKPAMLRVCAQVRASEAAKPSAVELAHRDPAGLYSNEKPYWATISDAR